MNNEKFILSYSGGKDCILAMYRKIQQGHTPVALLTTIKKSEEESWSHGLNYDLLERVSKSLNLPIICAECDIQEYESKFEEKLKEAKKLGATTIVYGDIDVEHHKQWGIDRAQNSGLNYDFPLWQENREKLVNEFIESGFKAVIKKVNLNYMDKHFLGEILDKNIVQEIKVTGCDVCGENGEYHTFVVDGPIFKDKIDVDIEKIKNQDSFRFDLI